MSGGMRRSPTAPRLPGPPPAARRAEDEVRAAAAVAEFVAGAAVGGGEDPARRKAITVSILETVKQDLDGLAFVEGRHLWEMVEEALSAYIEEKRRGGVEIPKRR